MTISEDEPVYTALAGMMKALAEEIAEDVILDDTPGGEFFKEFLMSSLDEINFFAIGKAILFEVEAFKEEIAVPEVK